MIEETKIYSFLEENFDYVMITDEEGCIVHTSTQLAEDLMSDEELTKNTLLKDIVTPSSWTSFQSAMQHTRDGSQGIAVFIQKHSFTSSISMKVGYIDNEGHALFFFFGNNLGLLTMPLSKLNMLQDSPGQILNPDVCFLPIAIGFQNSMLAVSSVSKMWQKYWLSGEKWWQHLGWGREKEWQQDERNKELQCIYKTAEFIEVSESVNDFFGMLPQYLSVGMRYPEKVVVYSVYDGVEYGQKLSCENHFSVTLTVWGQERGKIGVGYRDESIKLLPEEEKMLLEIRRMLNLALERKELKEKLSKMEEEETEYNSRLIKLTEEIDERTEELDKQKKKLSVVNSYLSRVNEGWDKAKSRLETIFKAIPDDVVLLDTNRKVVMTNRDDIEPGEYCYASVFGRDAPCPDCRLARIQESKLPVITTIKDGDKYLQVHSLPVYNKKEEVDGILEFYRDVTIEKTYEQQLQQADKLASIGKLVSGIGHEINNPNQFIRGNIKIVKQAFDDIVPILDEYYGSHPDLKIARLNYKFFRDHVMVLVDDMAHGSERIKTIVKSLRAFTMKDEGLLVDTVELNTLLEETIRFVDKEIHKQSEIRLELADNLPTFQGNAQKIEQVLINLIVNAGQAIPEERKGLLTVRTFEEDAYVVAQIEDNGCGMNETSIKQIFDPFFTTKRGKGGTGLGLAISFRIIEEHGGTIAVNSEPGVGTTFTIKIPAKQ